jgi:hypothetical protein
MMMITEFDDAGITEALAKIERFDDQVVIRSLLTLDIMSLLTRIIRSLLSLVIFIETYHQVPLDT